MKKLLMVLLIAVSAWAIAEAESSYNVSQLISFSGSTTHTVVALDTATTGAMWKDTSYSGVFQLPSNIKFLTATICLHHGRTYNSLVVDTNWANDTLLVQLQHSLDGRSWTQLITAAADTMLRVLDSLNSSSERDTCRTTPAERMDSISSRITVVPNALLRAQFIYKNKPLTLGEDTLRIGHTYAKKWDLFINYKTW